jgi:hypothetical protein
MSREPQVIIILWTELSFGNIQASFGTSNDNSRYMDMSNLDF